MYGILFGAAIVGVMLVNVVNARLVSRCGTDRLVRVGAFALAFAGMWAAVSGRTGLGGLAGLVVPLFLCAAMNGLIVANSLAGALSRWPHRAGAASALVGAIHYGSGIVGSGLVGLLADGTPGPLGPLMGLTGLGCLACTRLLPSRPLPYG